MSASDSPGLEIERVWVLRSMPEAIPQDAEVWTIEQGYMPLGANEASAHAGYPEGRLRRIVRSDGSEIFRHTTKRGSGMVREEVERSIDAAEFRRWWPLTEGRRVEKTRHRIRVDGLVWELDRFHSLPLVMLEVELPSPDAPARLPEWAAPLVVREVTEDARYRNAALATGGLPSPP